MQSECAWRQVLLDAKNGIWKNMLVKHGSNAAWTRRLLGPEAISSLGHERLTCFSHLRDVT